MRLILFIIIVMVQLCASTITSNSQVFDDAPFNNGNNINVLKLSLTECIELAKKKNNFYKTSEFDVKIAEAQYRQAKSAYWPNISLNTHYVHFDKDPMMVNAPTTMNVLGLSVDIPVQNVKLMDNDLLEGNIELLYPLYTGGKISSIIKQAQKGVEIANDEARKTDIEVVCNVKKMYYSVLISKILYEIAKDAFIKIDVTNSITKKMFEEGSGTVLKTDLLKSKMMTSTLSSLVKSLDNNAKMAILGLKNSLGLDPETEISILDDSIPYKVIDIKMPALMQVLYENHPDWGIVAKGLEALDARIDEAWSDQYPTIALFSNFTKTINSYDYGMVSQAYKNGWRVGLALQMPIFNGFLTFNRVDEAKAKYSKLTEQQKLLKNGLTTKLNIAYLKIQSAMEQEVESRSALETAIENRDLNDRAYQEDLVQAQDMMTAKIMESIMNAKYQLVLFDYQISKIELEALLGIELEKIEKKY